MWQRVRWDFTQHSRAAHFMEAVARLSPGTTFEQAQSAVDALGTRLAQENPRTNKGWNARLVPLLDEELGYYRPALMVLFGAVALLLVIGVLNVATLLLTRALSREKEIAVRVALGAAPRQLVTQLMAESLVLSVAGAIVGIAATAAALPLIISFTPVQIPRLDEAGVDVRALGLCLAVVAVTTVVFGLVPALLLLRTQFTHRSEGRRARQLEGRAAHLLGAGRRRSGDGLRAARQLGAPRAHRRPHDGDADRRQRRRRDDRDGAAVAVGGRCADARRHDRHRVGADGQRALANPRRDPRSSRASPPRAQSNFLPFSVGWRNPFLIDGQPRPARQEDLPQAQMHSVSEGYFEAMGATHGERPRVSATSTTRIRPAP